MTLISDLSCGTTLHASDLGLDLDEHPVEAYIASAEVHLSYHEYHLDHFRDSGRLPEDCVDADGLSVEGLTRLGRYLAAEKDRFHTDTVHSDNVYVSADFLEQDGEPTSFTIVLAVINDEVGRMSVGDFAEKIAGPFAEVCTYMTDRDDMFASTR